MSSLVHVVISQNELKLLCSVEKLITLRVGGQGHDVIWMMVTEGLSGQGQRV